MGATRRKLDGEIAIESMPKAVAANERMRRAHEEEIAAARCIVYRSAGATCGTGARSQRTPPCGVPRKNSDGSREPCGRITRARARHRSVFRRADENDGR